MTTLKHCHERLTAAVEQSENGNNRGLLERLEVFQYHAREVASFLKGLIMKADAAPAEAPGPYSDMGPAVTHPSSEDAYFARMVREGDHVSVPADWFGAKGDEEGSVHAVVGEVEPTGLIVLDAPGLPSIKSTPRALFEHAYPTLEQPEVAADEIDEDPPADQDVEAAKESAFQRGLELGRQEALEQLTAPEADRKTEPPSDFNI